jgi:hypothetical protein
MSETDPCHEEQACVVGVEKDSVATPQDTGYDNTEQDFDTGIKAWLQVLGSFFLYFNSWYEFPISF